MEWIILAPPHRYNQMKDTCDEYFFIPCRGEHRGVGGIFFDDVTDPWAPALCDALMKCFSFLIN